MFLNSADCLTDLRCKEKGTINVLFNASMSCSAYFLSRVRPVIVSLLDSYFDSCVLLEVPGLGNALGLSDHIYLRSLLLVKLVVCLFQKTMPLDVLTRVG